MKEFINDVIINDTEIDLVRPLEIEIMATGDESSDYQYIVVNEEFNIHGIGKTKEEAINDLKCMFDYLYKDYGICSDDKLTENAIKLKKKILEILGADEGSILIIDVREMSYEDAKKEIIEYRKPPYNYDAGLAELVDALWLDIDVVMQIVDELNKEHQFRWI